MDSFKAFERLKCGWDPQGGRYDRIDTQYGCLVLRFWCTGRWICVFYCSSLIDTYPGPENKSFSLSLLVDQRCDMTRLRDC